MKVYFLYRPNSEHARRVEEYVHDFRRQHVERRVEIVNLDTRDGAAMASLYDIMSFPAILATNDDGSYLKSWQGIDALPLMNDLAYYSHS